MRYLFTMMSLAAILGWADPSHAADVTVASDRMLVVDGHRTFVIGLYENPKDDAVLDEVARSGFNLVRASQDKSSLDRLHSRNLYAWINTGGRIELGVNREKQENELRDMVAGAGSHPALMVWEVPDEALWSCMLSVWHEPGDLLEKPARFNARAAELNARMVEGYKVLRQLDSKHPVWMNHAAGNASDLLAAFARAADIIGCDIYPLMPYPTRPVDVSRSTLASVGLCTTRMQRTAPDKPVWMVLQGVGWGDFEGIFKLRPEPGQQSTFAESRFMAYDVIARGARAVLYWGTHIIEKDSDLWKDLMKVAHELPGNQPLLSAPDAGLKPKATVTLFGFLPLNIKGCPLHVETLGKLVDGQTWWIVVNEFPMAISYALQDLGALEGKTYADTTSEFRAVVQNGVLKGDLPRYGVHVLKPADH